MSRKPLTRRRALTSFGSLLAASPLAGAQHARPAAEPPGRLAPLQELVNTLEFEGMAKRTLARADYTAIAESERKGFDRITFRPRLMVNTLNLNLSTKLFGETLFAPILAGPASHQKRFHPQGELAMARGAAAAKAAMVVSGRSDYPIEEIAKQTGTPLWYQVYPEPDAGQVLARIQEAVQAGCKAVCITVGKPYGPPGGSGQLAELAAMGNPGLDWEYVDRIRQATSVPLLLKGIMTPEEAQTAIERGVQGIVVSNHGGRFIEGLAEPITVLPEIADVVNRRISVLIDGGFRRGSDVLKALALGASAVLIGRPALWGLAAYGADGVKTVLELLQTELARDMTMCGAANIDALNRDFVKIHRR